MSAPFPIRAVVEGFYGVYYTVPERDGLIRFLARHGFTHYIYGPKADWYHRDRWREPYPDDMLVQLSSAVATAREVGIAFVYAIAPGLTICYASAQEFALLTVKLRMLYDRGVRDFSLFLDDIPPEFHCGEDRARYRSYGEAHADLSNRLHEWLQALDPTCTLSMCPTSYHGVPPFNAYLHELGEQLHPAIDIFYTGPDVCSPTIGVADVAAFAEAVRRPPLLWDNYPVNDAMMTGEMHIGPIRGRDAALAELARGIAVNPMNQPEASKIALLTFADFFADPHGYDPKGSWAHALRDVGGDAAYPSLCHFAENSLRSCLGTPEAEPLARHVAAALAALQAGEPTTHPAVAALDAYLLDLDDASFFLKHRLDNVALRNDLLPWLELLDLWVATGKRAMQVLRAREQGIPYDAPLRRLSRLADEAQRHPKQWGGSAMLTLVEYVSAKIADRTLQIED